MLPGRPSFLCLLFAMALAGCSDPAPSDWGPAGPSAEVADHFPLDNSGNDCREGMVAKVVSMAHAAALLPDGFAPGDAQALLGLPAPTGQSAVFLTTFTCAQSAFGADALLQSDVGVLVEAPRGFDGPEPALLNLYFLGSYTTTPAVVEALGRAGHPVMQHAPVILVDLLPTGSTTADGVVSDEDGVAMTYHITAPMPRPFSTQARFWSATDAGLLYAEYNLDNVPTAAGTASCSMRAGSLPAQVFGATDCSGVIIALTLNDAEWDSTYVLLPGARAT